MRSSNRHPSWERVGAQSTGTTERRSLTQVGRDLRQLRERVLAEAEEHPLRTAGLAILSGYLLGGGLFSRLTARLVGRSLRLGLRIAFIPLIAQGLVAATFGEDPLRAPGADNDREAGARDPARDYDDRRDDIPPAADVGPFAREQSNDDIIPRRPPRPTDPKENNS